MASGTTSFLRESLVPFLSNIVDLGASFLRWRKIWTSDFDANGVVTVSRTPTATTDAANKAYVDAALAPTIATIEEVDGAPSIASPDKLIFDQADGFVVSNPAGNNVRVDLAAIPNAALVTIGVATGGTGLTGGTSGGVLGYTAAGTLASSAALTARALVIGGGAGATPTTIAALTNGQLPIGSTGADPVPASITGTANQVVVTPGAGSITLSTPQDIAAASSPTFANPSVTTLTLTGAAPATPVANRLYSDSTCHAWLTLDGDAAPATILADYNISSVTDNAVGDYTPNFATAMSAATYSVLISILPANAAFTASARLSWVVSKLVGSVTVRTASLDAAAATVAEDQPEVYLAIFGSH